MITALLLGVYEYVWTAVIVRTNIPRVHKTFRRGRYFLFVCGRFFAPPDLVSRSLAYLYTVPLGTTL